MKNSKLLNEVLKALLALPYLSAALISTFNIQAGTQTYNTFAKIQ